LVNPKNSAPRNRKPSENKKDKLSSTRIPRKKPAVVTVTAVCAKVKFTNIISL